MPSTTLKDVDQHKFVKAFAQFLKNVLTGFNPSSSDTFLLRTERDNVISTLRIGVTKKEMHLRIMGVSDAFDKSIRRWSGKLKVPEWVDLVKTARSKELAPYDNDWYYIRCAAVIRHIYIRSPVGVGSVTKIFGSRKRNGTMPSHFCRSAGSIARKALQSLEALKLIEKSPDGGRKITNQGRRDLDRIAAQVKAKEREQLKAGVIILS